MHDPLRQVDRHAGHAVAHLAGPWWNRQVTLDAVAETLDRVHRLTSPILEVEGEQQLSSREHPLAGLLADPRPFEAVANEPRAGFDGTATDLETSLGFVAADDEVAILVHFSYEILSVRMFTDAGTRRFVHVRAVRC